jgi:hypothetical protein
MSDLRVGMLRKRPGNSEVALPAATRTKKEGRHDGRPSLGWCKQNVLVTLRSGGTKSDLHVRAGARGWIPPGRPNQCGA